MGELFVPDKKIQHHCLSSLIFFLYDIEEAHVWDKVSRSQIFKMNKCWQTVHQQFNRKPVCERCFNALRIFSRLELPRSFNELTTDASYISYYNNLCGCNLIRFGITKIQFLEHDTTIRNYSEIHWEYRPRKTWQYVEDMIEVKK